MMSMYQAKKKEVDPMAPLRPSLLGHEKDLLVDKEMKTWRERFRQLDNQNTQQAITIATLQRKVNRLESQIEALTSFVKQNAR